MPCVVGPGLACPASLGRAGRALRRWAGLGVPCVVGPGWACPWAAARRYFGHRSQACAFRLDCSVCRWAAALPPPTGTAPRPRSQASHPAITHIIAEPTPNSARNSPTTISNLEFPTLELQRFQTLLKLHPIELRATFLRTSPAATAHGHHRRAPAASHRHRAQAPHPAITHAIPAPPNSARNSPTTISNLEFPTLELQRFQTLLKLHPIELRATFLRTSPAATAHGHRAQALSNLAVSGTGIPRGYPQALFLSDSYPQGSDSAWITRCHTRSVDVDGPTRGPTKE